MADPNIVNPYERIWKTRDLSALKTPIELENNTSQFGRGLNAFGKEMQATGYGIAALGAQGLENVIGENSVTSGITDWGIEGYKKAIDESQSGYNAPNVADVSNIKGVGDLTDWASYQLGKGLPMLGSLALSGGIGGAIGRLTAQEGVKQIAKGAVGSAVKKGVEAKALQATEGQIITKAMQETAAKALRDRAVAGAMTGGFAGSFGLEGGLAFGEQVQDGVKPEDAVKSAIAVGGINGALEFLPFYKVAKDIGMGQYAKKSIANIIKNDAGLSKKAVALATAKELGGRAAKGGLEGTVAEGITEGLQELTSIAGLRWAKQDPLFADLTDDDWNRIGNAAAAGALVGGVAAGAGATLKGPEVTDNATTDTNAPSAGTAAPAVKTREQEIEATLAKLTVNLEAAKAAGDTKTIQELQQLKELFDAALGKQKPVIEPVLETPPNEQITEEQPIPGATETQARPPLEIPTGPERTGGIREEGTGTETGLETREVVQPRPGESIQLKRGEEIVLTPDGTPAVRTTPTPEEVAALQQRMGPRPEKPITQPIEETANGQEVQAQTETQVAPTTKKVPVWTPKLLMEIAAASEKQAQNKENSENHWINFFADINRILSVDPSYAESAAKLLNKNATPIPESLQTQPDSNRLINKRDLVANNSLINNEPVETQPAPVKGFTLLPNGINSLFSPQSYGEYSNNTKVYMDDLGETVLLADTENNLYGYAGIDGQSHKFDSIDKLIEFANGQEANKEFVEIQEPNLPDTNTDNTSYLESLNLALMDGKPAESLTKIVNAFGFGSPNAKWNLQYEPEVGVVTIESKNQKNSPTWEISWNDADDTFNITTKSSQGVTDQILKDFSLDDIYYVKTLLPNVDPWVLAELKADIAQLSAAEIISKWGTDVADIANDYPHGTDLSLIQALSNNANWFDNWSNGELATYIKSGKIPPAHLGGEAAQVLVKYGYAPNTVEAMAKNAPPGWELLDANPVYTMYSNKEQDSTLFVSAEGYTWESHKYGTSLPYATKEDFLEAYNKFKTTGVFPNSTTQDTTEQSIVYDVNFDSASSQDNVTDSVSANTSWAPVELPGGYTIEAGKIITAENMYISTPNLSNAEQIDVAHIHNYLRHAQISLEDKLTLFKELPKTSNELAAFKAKHPFLLRKVSIDEANTVAQAKILLDDILTRRDKYTFSEILQQAIAFEKKFGNEEFIAALAEAPKVQYQPPHLDGWLANMRSEEDLLSENPFETIWADYEVNGGNEGAAARYGVVVINPKTGKVLLRKVANQYEGITWDFARGGAERFAAPDAKSNLIDTNGLGTQNASAEKRYMEHPLVAAKREAKEEFGYDVKVIGQLAKGFYTSNSGYESTMASLYYVAVPVSNQTTEHLKPTSKKHIKETDETRWVDIHEARKLVMTEPTLPVDYKMKRDGKHKARLSRISRTLDAVFNPAMQHSDLDYRSSAKAMELYFYDKLATEFPGLLSPTALKKNFYNLTELQKLNVAAALYVSKRFPNYDTEAKNKLQKEVYTKRSAALKKWMEERIGKTTVSNIIPGNASIETLDKYLSKTGGKAVLSLWHGSKNTREAMIDDVINPVYLGWGWGGNDTANGMFFSDTKELATKWGSKKQHNILVAFDKLKIIPGVITYTSDVFENIIKKAKEEGYDGVLFDYVKDYYGGRQVVAWNANNMIAAGGEGIGFTGKNLYQSKGELGERLDVDTAKTLLEDTFGPLAQRLLDSGILEFVESGGPDGIAGQWFGEEQKIRIYLDYVSSPRELIGAVLHEGAHAGLREILGKSADIYHKELLGSNNPAVKSAIYKTALEGAKRYGIENNLAPGNSAEIERVRAELLKVDQDFLIEEDLANFVQNADPSLPLWRKIFNAIKAWWAQSTIGKALKERNIGFELTPEMAAGLVTAALQTQSLRRGNDYSTYVAHASGVDWKGEGKHPYGRPQLKYILSAGGEGFINYGWGFYASESVTTHKYYKDTVGKKTYGLHVPDDIPPRMIEWDRELWRQSSIVKDMITSSRDNYLMLRMAVKSKDRKSSYPNDNGLNLQEKGTGGAFYNQLRDYFIALNYNGESGYIYDAETNQQQKVKNLARRDASRKLTEYGIAGVRLLDAGSRKITITKLENERYRVSRGITKPEVKEFSEQEFVAYVGPDLASIAKTYPVGENKNHAGFGFYNWVFWRQSDLDRFTVVYKDGNQVATKPKINVSYDPNGTGIPYADLPKFTEYVINPKTGEAHPQLSKAENTLEITTEELRNSIDSVMGNGWLTQAEKVGLVEVIKGVGPNNESGSWDGNKIRLYTGSMPVGGTPTGVLLHEGKHATFRDVLGKALDAYAADLRTLANAGNQSARNAITHATIAAAELLGIEHGFYDSNNNSNLDDVRAEIEAIRPGLLAEEELAYFVQYGADTQTGTGFWKRLVNQIKAWFAQTGLGQRMKELGIGFELTDAMAVEWAKMGLNRSLAELRQAERQVESAKQKPASVRLGSTLEKLEVPDALYSMGTQEIKQQLWNDPTDIRPEIVNKPGLLQKWRADFIDFFAEMEKKSKDIYDTYSLLRSKKAARIEQARQEYFLPLRKLIAESPWSAQEVGDMAAARHIKVDHVNTRLAQQASYGYTKELLKALPTAKRKELMRARVNVKAGKMPNGDIYLDANNNPARMVARTKQQLMFDLMNQYSQYEITGTDGIQVLREEWELFKDAAAGFSDGGVGSTKVRTVNDVLKLADKDRAKFDQIMTLFDAANRHKLELLEDGGLITAAEHARLLLDKSAYAPLRRESYKVDEEIARLFQRAGQGGSKQIATRSGTENLSEPTLVLQNALAAIEAAAAAAERNLANKELYKVVVKDRAGWKPWFTIVEKEKYVTHDEDGFLQEKNATASNRADITLINDGKKLVIRPNMHNERAMGFVRAVNNLDAQVVNGPMKVLGWLNQIVRWVNVSASPVFLMMNAFRDPFTALYNVQATEAEKYTKEIFNSKTYKDSFRALKKVFMDGNRDPNDPDVQWVERWELAGGRTSFVETLRDMDETWKSFDAQVARRKGTIFGINTPGFKGLMQAKDKWIDGLENFNILFENVMRFSTFKVLMEKGAVSEARAARISQDLTTNFTRRGYKTQALGTWWLFFNATMQGNYQVIRNLMQSKKLQAAVGGTVVMALLLDLLGRAVDDDWDKIPEWDKERFIILPVKVAGDFVRIPAPWVYNVVWRTGGLLGEMLSGVKAPQDGLLDIATMITTTFNPLGKPGSLAQAISPTGFDPFMQILENKNFSGNPIGPEGFPGASKKANSELMWSSTPKGYQSFARFVNEATGGSAVESGGIDLKPGDYQILVNFLTGSLGRFLSDATFGVKEALDKDFEGMKDIPVVKEFFSDPYDPLKSQKYHTNVAGIYGAYKLEQMYLKGPDRDLIKLQEVRQEREKELRMYSQAQDVERQLKSLRVRLRTAQNRGDTAREKELRDKIGKIQERFNNVYQQRMG